MSNKKFLGTLYIISAPSGGGKTSLVNALLKKLPGIEVSISHTTRPQRPGEQNGINYYFVDPESFQKQIEKNLFLEYATVFDSYYGTSKQWVEEKLIAGIDVILEIDWQGAQQIRKLMPDCISVFILPPSKETLAARLRERAQDSEKIITKRLAAARTEISHCFAYDYLIINDDFDHALFDLQSIIQAHRLRTSVQKIKQSSLIQGLLS